MVHDEATLEHPQQAELVRFRHYPAPPRSRVVIYNDDYTPMEFVVDAITRVFGVTESYATQVTIRAHYEGRAELGAYPSEIAETKAHQLNTEARQAGHPLLCQAIDM